jgi:hypothetical protein
MGGYGYGFGLGLGEQTGMGHSYSIRSDIDGLMVLLIRIYSISFSLK